MQSSSHGITSAGIYYLVLSLLHQEHGAISGEVVNLLKNLGHFPGVELLLPETSLNIQHLDGLKCEK